MTMELTPLKKSNMSQWKNNVSTSTFQKLSGVQKCKYVDKWNAKVAMWSYNLLPGNFFRFGLFVNMKWDELLYIDQKYKTWPEKWKDVLKRLWNMYGHDFFPSVWFLWISYIDQHQAFQEHSEIEGLESLVSCCFPFSYEISQKQFNKIVVAECLWQSQGNFEHSWAVYTGDQNFFFQISDFPSRLKYFIREKKDLCSCFSPALVHSVKSHLRKYLNKNS